MHHARPVLALFAFASLFALACNTPREAHDGASLPAAPPPVAPASAPPPLASASASAPPLAPASAPRAPGACTKDDECRTFSSYCEEAPCACRALSASDPDPKCAGNAPTKVRCFVDPCMKKAASCQSGACVLTLR